MKTLLITIIALLFFKPLLNWFASLLYGFLDQINSLIVSIKYGQGNLFRIYREWGKYNYNSAFNLDIYAQYNFRSLWNLIFSKGGFKFGTNKEETISSVLGFKKLEKSLRWFGLVWYYFLYAVDVTKWGEGGHCANAIDWELHELINI